jgi:hypothetical protein
MWTGGEEEQSALRKQFEKAAVWAKERDGDALHGSPSGDPRLQRGVLGVLLQLRRIRPYLGGISFMISRKRLAGMTNAMFWAPSRMATATPINSASMFITGPPEFPGLMLALVCIVF